MVQKLVALTFDDGPSNVTSQILDILEANGAVATFFLIGNNVTKTAKPIISRQMALGCELANHSLTHNSMMNFSKEEILNEIDETSSRIEAMGGNKPKFFRAPYDDISETMFETIELPFIIGLESGDWMAEQTVLDCVNNVMSQTRDGAIIVMHDFTDNVKTVEALPIIISNLKALGYDLVTLGELFEKKRIEPKVKGKIWNVAENATE